MKLTLTVALLVAAPAPAADEKDSARLPEGPGKEIAGRICLECHDSGNFRKARLTSEEGRIRWRTWWSAAPKARHRKSKRWSSTWLGTSARTPRCASTRRQQRALARP